MLTRFITATAFISSFVYASMAPSYPEPGTIWKTGQQYAITWFNDKQSPSIDKGWKKFKIDFMTGDNNNQKFLKNIAENLDGSTLKSFNWTAPEVQPNAAVYFLMFTNEKGDHAWTTRFGIAGADGKLEKPEHATQPDGAKIPWGVGKLVMQDASGKPKATASYSMTPVMSSVAEQNASVQIAVSNNAGIITPHYLFLIFFILYPLFTFCIK